MPTDQNQKPPSKPSTQKLYGKRTLGVLIHQALSQAGLASKEGTSKSTDYFRALIDHKVRQASARMKVAMIALGVAAIALVAVVSVLLFRPGAQGASTNNDTSTGAAIASSNRYNIFMLAGVPKDETGNHPIGFCSAFSVSDNTLATCGHCVQDTLEKYDRVVAVMNGASSNSFKVLGAVAHPEFKRGQLSPDVGLLRIDGQLPYFSRMATQADLHSLSPGDPVYLYGFPGRLADTRAPEATFIKGDLGRVTTIDLRTATPPEHDLLQHSAFTSSGTSGSPLFNAAGHVIGINTGGYSEGNEKLVGYNVALRVDLIRPLFDRLESI